MTSRNSVRPFCPGPRGVLWLAALVGCAYPALGRGDAPGGPSPREIVLREGYLAVTRPAVGARLGLTGAQRGQIRALVRRVGGLELARALACYRGDQDAEGEQELARLKARAGLEWEDDNPVEEVIEKIGEVLTPAQRATFARLYGDLSSRPAARPACEGWSARWRRAAAP